MWVIESASQYVADVLWRGLAQGVEHDLRVEAYDHAQHLDMGWHEGRASGTTLATLNDDVNQLERFLDVGAAAILQTALNVLLVGAVSLRRAGSCSSSPSRRSRSSSPARSSSSVASSRSMRESARRSATSRAH